MSRGPLRLALIGCGRAAERLHLPALLATNEASLVAIADPSEERCATVTARAPSCAAFGSAQELLGGVDLDGVVVATPVPTHVSIIQAVLEVGVPALVEKPLAASLAEAEHLATVAHNSTAWMMMAFHRRFLPAVQHLHELVQQHDLGEVARVDTVFRIDPRDWNAHEERSDALDDLFCHQCDLLRFLFGRELTALSAQWIDSTEIQIDAEFEGGLEARCVVGHGAPFCDQTVVRFRHVTYTIGADSKYVRRRGSTDWRRVLGAWGRRFRLGVGLTRSAHDKQLAAFCAALRQGRAVAPDLNDGLAAVRAVDAARRSVADDGRKVSV